MLNGISDQSQYRLVHTKASNLKCLKWQTASRVFCDGQIVHANMISDCLLMNLFFYPCFTASFSWSFVDNYCLIRYVQAQVRKLVLDSLKFKIMRTKMWSVSKNECIQIRHMHTYLSPWPSVDKCTSKRSEFWRIRCKWDAMMLNCT